MTSKEKKTMIAVLLSIVVVIIAFYVRITPPPEQQQQQSDPSLAGGTVPEGSGIEDGPAGQMPINDGSTPPPAEDGTPNTY